MARTPNRILAALVLATAAYSATQLLVAFVSAPAASSSPPRVHTRGSVALQARGG
eukprot:CAMPEP_0175385674 /NCGR_PEP_ID=MMETSP0095-20121207/28974_1 /TAXON_ID=311494 /ORGANISM="Alexandrium monilatum, Strain CCMP3105" /LENGTH=54 /DNA_ID=CAMNT_0016684119 /DNA_START=35 /DNA_END=196 /DNA_ORIENTATION=+